MCFLVGVGSVMHSDIFEIARKLVRSRPFSVTFGLVGLSVVGHMVNMPPPPSPWRVSRHISEYKRCVLPIKVAFTLETFLRIKIYPHKFLYG